jgi:hypothetical protein
MTNLLTRRLALFRIASVAGTPAAVAAATVALAAVQPKTPENPELLAAGKSLIVVANECVRLAHERAQAREKVMSVWPALPAEICIGKYSEQIGTDNEADCDGEALNRGGLYHLSIYNHYYSTYRLNERLAELPMRGGTAAEKRERQTIKRLLPIAAGYEHDCDAAKNAHGYQPITVAHETAQFSVQELLYKISSLSALTPDGITIKAQAYQACAALGKEERFQATIHLGPSIAEDVCRILSEGDEA